MSLNTNNQEKEHVKCVESSLLHVLTAQECGLTSLSDDAMAAPKSFAVAVKGLLLNWRQGTVACKGRSQVTGSNKKPWKQKGTGRARCGDAKSPLWRGGGVTFGPQKRTRTLKISKKTKKSVYQSMLFDAFNRGIIMQMDWKIEGNEPKTKQAFTVLKNAGLHGEHVNVFVQAHDALTISSFANIPSVRLVLFDAVNVYELADAAYWIVLKKDKDFFQEMVARWN